MKKTMQVAFVAAFAAVAGYNIYMNQKSDTMSDIMLANVEALAGGEYDTPFYVAPCKHGPGSECRSAKYDEENRCSKLTYC